MELFGSDGGRSTKDTAGEGYPDGQCAEDASDERLPPKGKVHGKFWIIRPVPLYQVKIRGTGLLAR